MWHPQWILKLEIVVSVEKQSRRRGVEAAWGDFKGIIDLWQHPTNQKNSSCGILEFLSFLKFGEGRTIS